MCLLCRNKKVSKDVKRKVLAEKRAHELVEKLLEEDVSEEFFMKSVSYLCTIFWFQTFNVHLL